MIRDCRYERDTGFGNFNKRVSGNIAFKNRDRGSPVTKCTKKATVHAEHEKLGTNVWCSCASALLR